MQDQVQDPEVARRVVAYLTNTAETTVSVDTDGAFADTTFVITGDIPAMWLRDSAAQLTPLLRLVVAGFGNDGDRAVLLGLLTGLLRRHWLLIEDDPYANAFNHTADASHWDADRTERDNPLTWERKFELDSLSYGVDLAWRLWKATGSVDWDSEHFLPAVREILRVVRIEQDHEARSAYRFERSDCPESDTLARDGRGGSVEPCGMVWAGFRPSDDRCELGYNIPGNLFLALALEHLAELLEDALTGGTDRGEFAAEARAIAEEIRAGVAEHGVIDGPDGERILAYEVDARGNHLFLDDANVPSLLGLPYLGCLASDDPLYRATRRAVLSTANPYYYEGSQLSGVGSPHTPPRYVWPIAKAMEGLTNGDDAFKAEMLALMIATDGGTGMMHEGVDVDDPTNFTRAWFSWSNSMFCELALDLAGVHRDQPGLRMGSTASASPNTGRGRGRPYPS
jgi:meiotically up-regulated gene 157 (Mug157) protein